GTQKFPAIRKCVHTIPLSDVLPGARNPENWQTRGPASSPALSFPLPTSNTPPRPSPSSFRSACGARPNFLQRLLNSVLPQLPTHPSAIGFYGPHPGQGSPLRIASATLP